MTDEYFAASTFQICWPRHLVAAELDRLIGLLDRRQPITGALVTTDWEPQVEQFMREAFSDEAALGEWKLAARGVLAGDWGVPTQPVPAAARADVQWLRELRAQVALLPLPQARVPYWSQRQRPAPSAARAGLREVARGLAALVGDLEKCGYLVWAFGQQCPDGSPDGYLGAEPVEAVHQALGRTGLWPVHLFDEDYSVDDLCDVIEFVADHVRRPTRTEIHQYFDEVHYESFDAERGLQVYRWRVNQLLDDSTLELTLAATGRLEHTASGGTEDLVSAVRNVESVHDADALELNHALAQFRARLGSTLDRRTAVQTLAGILERRRSLIKKHLISKDEGALFQLANNFGIRHQNASQQGDYDADLYLEWIFYWYLATIHLTNRIVTSQESASV